MRKHLVNRCRGSRFLVALSFFLLSSPTVQAQDKKPKIHTPAEILVIMDQSRLTYEIDIDDSLSPAVIDSPIVLSNQMFLKETADGLALTTFKLSDTAAETLKLAEEAFQKNDFESALKFYLVVQKLEPEYYHVMTLIGDVFYNTQQYDLAKEYFEKAIENNFADYNAHWFLGDTEWHRGKKKEAVRNITIAHLLNVNHQSLKETLGEYRKRIDRPWQRWEFSPRFSLSQEGEKVYVKFSTDWMGYALVKAVWKYEPGYAEATSGPGYEKLAINMLEEKEALVALLTHNEKLKHITKIIEDGYVDEFIYYELLAKRVPMALVLLPREDFDRLIEYVDTYH